MYAPYPLHFTPSHPPPPPPPYPKTIPVIRQKERVEMARLPYASRFQRR